jgi:hypothetical protein
MIEDQVRIGYKGAYALDLAAVVLVLELFPAVRDFCWELVKMKMLFNEKYMKE